MAKKYWLLKSEPDCFSFTDLMQAPDRTTYWDGVRNYQARNFLRDEIKVGDQVLYYHSGGPSPHIAGLAQVVRAGYPDHTAFVPAADHFDPKSSPDDPTWYMVDIQAQEELPRPLPLSELREVPALQDMVLLQRSRLSVQPVTADEWRAILAQAKRPR
ncbi:EVE domain-containing protein [candidate division BRC1 bacterium HGW-BRC1-1]|jgi:predicted RNA-binding protein with PUA-like domain|nr:MAG: EVE domain-containing protein [candidate division BRC1 bacterium HGW-BRC1-1]